MRWSRRRAGDGRSRVVLAGPGPPPSSTSTHSSTQRSQMETPGPAISLLTESLDFPQNEQRGIWLAMPPTYRLTIAL